MKLGGGHAKGAAFERDVCRRLSLWVSGGKHTDLFWRSSLSGGRATVAHKRGGLVRQAGDICAVVPEGHALTDRIFLECKHVRSLDLESFLLRDKGVLAGFWRTAVQEAAKYEREPLIIARQNRCKDIIVFRQASLQAIVPTFTGTYILSSKLGQGAVEIRMFEDLLAVPFTGGKST